MGAKKVMTYGRYIMVAVLVFYLILVWMYFKDNALQLTSKGLFLWFVLIPLIMVAAIIVIMWQQKKLERKASIPTLTTEKVQPTKQPDIYQLFIHSSIGLPEGENWSAIIANDEDLTVLSTDLSDFDGLPILTKPITRVITEPDLLYSLVEAKIFKEGAVNSDNVDEGYFEEQASDLDDLTLRLGALILQQLALNEAYLYTLAEHFEMLTHSNDYEANSAIHIHHEWQQHHIVSANNDSSADYTSTDTSIVRPTQLSIFICLPALADSAFIADMIKQQLSTYGIPEQHFIVTLVTSDDVDNSNIDDGTTTLNCPEQFIHKHLIRVSKAAMPEVCFLIAADSQINEPWLESNVYVDAAPNIIPTEASTLLIFSNKAAQDNLDMNDAVSFSLTEIGNALSKDNSNLLDTENNASAHNSNSHYNYSKNLKDIKQLLLDSSFDLSELNNTIISNANQSALNKKQLKSPKSEQSMTNDSLLEKSITILSDINPSPQPYDLSEFMTFTASFSEKGALVNEHHLGHYMPLNVWLKSFISLALLADLVNNDRQQSEHRLLITQHKSCCMLWLADSL